MFKLPIVVSNYKMFVTVAMQNNNKHDANGDLQCSSTWSVVGGSLYISTRWSSIPVEYTAMCYYLLVIN